MIYIKNYFDKDNIEDVSYQDIVDFFENEQKESDTLEFKSFVSQEGESVVNKEKTIIKTISAFLNSEGGLLIWGTPIGQMVEGKNEKIFVGELSLVTQLYEKDQFISKITNRITPVPNGLLFHRIEHNENYIYLIEVNKSEYSPHQFENRFYMRLDGQTRVAPYHYIEALFKRIKYPNIQGFVTLNEFRLVANSYWLTLTSWIFNTSPLQNDFDLSIRLICDIGRFVGWNELNPNPRIVYDNGGHEKRVKQVKDIVHYGEPISHTDTIEFNPHELQREGNTSRIVLSFGAKNSPMKISSYTVQLSTTGPVNLNEALIEINENKNAGDGPSNNTEEEKIRRIIGRDPT